MTKLDKFYTAQFAVDMCVGIVKRNVPINKNKDFIIEPSAGGGAFIDSIKQLTKRYKFYDIKPEHPEIEQKDFLKMNVNRNCFTHKIIVIGNCPFGSHFRLCIKFIKKCSEFADTIAFILPQNFKKKCNHKYFPREFHLIAEQDLPNNSFIEDAKIRDLRTVFQIWEKRDNLRPN